MSRMEITNEEELSEFLRKHSENLSVIYFWAAWAAQCQQMFEILEELSKDSSLFAVKFVDVEAEKFPEVSKRFKIESVPTFIFVRHGKEIDRLVGANGAELNRKIRHLLATELPKPATHSAKAIEDRLKELIGYDRVMLFMKGSPNEPKCGFSRQIVAILNAHTTKYSTFDILTDQEVREGLKKFSNWPTFPQLYVNGELMGGLDVVKELEASGELEQILKNDAKEESTLESRLQKLVRNQHVMLFMKGSPQTPKCGFSRQIVQILNDTSVPFGHFDILEDEEVRQALKTFSNWPTYPQLYVNGQLIGGLDIVKELKEAGELSSTLQNTPP